MWQEVTGEFHDGIAQDTGQLTYSELRHLDWCHQTVGPDSSNKVDEQCLPDVLYRTMV